MLMNGPEVNKILEELRKNVCKANKDVLKHGLVILTWGNVSAIDKERKIVAIKPSGIDPEELKLEQIVLVDMEGNIIEGELKPSSDTPTHIEIYKNFPGVNGVVHTHSTYATIFAQAKKEIHCLGTTHADHFYGTIPITREMTKEEIGTDYERNTGKVIVELYKQRKIDPLQMPACLVASHGPFTWGENADKAVENAFVLEQVANMNFFTHNLNHEIMQISPALLDRHYLRKHGNNAYYGQKK